MINNLTITFESNGITHTLSVPTRDENLPYNLATAFTEIIKQSDANIEMVVSNLMSKLPHERNSWYSVNYRLPPRDVVVIVLDDEGKWYDIEQSECLLFPSKDNRDWNKFNLPVNTLKPFDKVLVRDGIDEKWTISLFSYHDKENQTFPYVCASGRYVRCIPYKGNEHLLGTPNTPIIES